MSATAQRSAAQVAEALDRVSRRPELDDEPTLFERALEWLVEHLVPSAGPEAFGVVESVARVLVAVLVAAALTLIVLAVVRRLRRARATVAPGAAVHERVAELRRLAAEARARGDVALALRYLLFALVLGLGQRGDLQYRDAWTNRELIERGRPTERVRALLMPLVLELEAKEFGRAPVEPADVERLAGLCERWLDRPGASGARNAPAGAAEAGA